jgi:hypothetical protein
MATALKRPVSNPEEIQKKWIEDVNAIMNEISGWFSNHREKPAVRPSTNPITEAEIGTYTVPGLDVVFAADFRDAITVEPIGRNYPNKGVIDVISWPKLRRVYLAQESDGQWTIYTESNIPLHQEWNESNFHRLIDDLRAEL